MKHTLARLPPLNVAPPLPKNPQAVSVVSIGAGAIVTLGHLPAYKLAGFPLKGIFDVDRQKAMNVAKEWDIPHVYSSINEACAASANEDVVFDIAVPSKQIVPILKHLPANSHVLIQKPMGENLTDAQAIVEMCKARHIHGSVNFQLRYAPYILALKDAIHRGWLGDRLTTIELHVNAFTAWSSWPFLATAPRLELIYHSIHYVDLVRELLAPHEPSAVHCRTSQHAAMPHLTPVRSMYSLKFEHDPMLFVNIYTNHHHRWGDKQAQSYLLVEGTGGAAKAQIGDNLAYGQSTEGKQVDRLEVTIVVLPSRRGIACTSVV